MIRRYLGVLAGRDLPLDSLRAWAVGAERILAADSGADRLIEAGVRPHVVIGDLDSTDLVADGTALDIRLDDDQETTDCDKLLRLAESEGALGITLVGVEGDRFDHMMASVHSAAKSRLAVRLGLRRGIGQIVRPGSTLVPCSPGRRFSLLPIVPCGGLTLNGATWPLTDSELHPLGQTSVSNYSSGDLISIELQSGVALLVVEYRAPELPIW